MEKRLKPNVMSDAELREERRKAALGEIPTTQDRSLDLMRESKKREANPYDPGQATAALRKHLGDSALRDDCWEDVPGKEGA